MADGEEALFWVSGRNWWLSQEAQEYGEWTLATRAGPGQGSVPVAKASPSAMRTQALLGESGPLSRGVAHVLPLSTGCLNVLCSPCSPLDPEVGPSCDIPTMRTLFNLLWLALACSPVHTTLSKSDAKKAASKTLLEKVGVAWGLEATVLAEG